MQESTRKGVERAFDVLKQRWHILHNLARIWHPTRLRKIMYACIILHNMILEDEEHTICGVVENDLEADEVVTQISVEQRTENVREVRTGRLVMPFEGIWSNIFGIFDFPTTTTTTRFLVFCNFKFLMFCKFKFYFVLSIF